MGLFDTNKLENLIDRQLTVIENLQRELSKCNERYHHCCCKKAHPVHLALTISINKSTFIIMSLEISANQLSVGTLSLIDSVTSAPVAATFSGTTVVSDNSAIATAAVNADGTITITGVSAGTCNVTTTSTASFTNSLGVATTGTVASTVAVTIDAVATADGVTLVITFAPATNQ